MDEPAIHETKELSVRESQITRPGSARMNTTTFQQLGLDTAHNKIDITSDNTTVTRRAYPDNTVGYQDIYLRKDARTALHVSEHDIVTVTHHRSLGTSTRERLTGPLKQVEIRDQTVALQEH